jgi:hypothetical protein
MLTEEEVRQALHARRAAALGVPNPHGPLGLEQLAAAVRGLDEQGTLPGEERVQRPIAVRPGTWDKLVQMAEETSHRTASHVNASALASAIIEAFVAEAGSKPGDS